MPETSKYPAFQSKWRSFEFESKKSLEYFLLASGVNDEKRKRVLLLHLIGAKTQESNTDEDCKTAIVKFDEYFDHKKSVAFEGHNIR